MHGRGVLHRDPKPTNVLYSEGGKPKVADFGLARQLPHAADPRDDSMAPIRFDLDALAYGGHPGEVAPVAGRVERASWQEGDHPGTVVAETETGCLIGTPSYVSPEQARGDLGQVGPEPDVYSLGVVLYEMVVGRPPLRGRTAMETLELVIQSRPEPLRRVRPNVPLELESICARCLEPEPNRRYHSAMGVVEDLRRFIASGTTIDEAASSEVEEVAAPAAEASTWSAPTSGRRRSMFQNLLRRITGSS
jgi:serine/threonine protein kinase